MKDWNGPPPTIRLWAPQNRSPLPLRSQQDPSYRAEDADPDEPVIEVNGGLAWRQDWWIFVDVVEIWQIMQRMVLLSQHENWDMFIRIASTVELDFTMSY